MEAPHPPVLAKPLPIFILRERMSERTMARLRILRDISITRRTSWVSVGTSVTESGWAEQVLRFEIFSEHFMECKLDGHKDLCYFLIMITRIYILSFPQSQQSNSHSVQQVSFSQLSLLARRVPAHFTNEKLMDQHHPAHLGWISLTKTGLKAKNYYSGFSPFY